MSRPTVSCASAAMVFVVACTSLLSITGPEAAAAPPAETPQAGSPSPLPLPGSLPAAEYEQQLYEFLSSKRYQDLGWKKDRAVRDTGPFIDKTYYGVHPAVRIFYSPEVYDWLDAGRPENGIPDGAMIIKEMYTPPAARWAGNTDAELRDAVNQWTVMVKDASASKDGWYWSYYGTEYTPPVDNAYPFSYPWSGFGLYCVRCHASTVPGGESTFASLRNIEGEEAAGDPIIYRVDDSWRETSHEDHKDDAAHPAADAQPSYDEAADRKPYKAADPDFLALFDAIEPVARADVQRIPPVTLDRVISSADGPGQFITSFNCMSCHDGQATPLGNNMTLLAEDGSVEANLSPYGEWRWSMMGLAGRDPIFYAQLESEISIRPEVAEDIENLCFRCHGVMGQRQFHLDNPSADARFTREIPLGDWQPGTDEYKYAALARDGVSCMLCHQIVDDGRPFAEIVTGEFEISAPEGDTSRIYGPFEDVVTLPMENALGITPVGNEYTTGSRLCGSCHSIYLPVYGNDGAIIDHDYEQSTYLEWLNSDYRTELGTGSDPKDCQDCHMKNDYHGEPLDFRIANIQDTTYPEADFLAPAADITLKSRPEFRRHTLLGINIWGLEMFNQFDEILGVRTSDYMSGSNRDLANAIDNADRLAKEETATVEISNSSLTGNRLDVTVEVTNLAGHRLPSGAGFRRAFLELLVVDAHNTVVWGSGRTNSLGVIVDARGRPLASEFFADIPGLGQAYEPHYDRIERQDQVQIYQELVKNPDGRFTTSFVGQAETVKDNRLLPKGWTPNGPPGFAPSAEHAGDKQWDFPEATSPKGEALDDERFLDGTASDAIEYRIALPPHVAEQLQAGGTVEVRATLFYQAIPPSWLRQRFATAQGESGKRLHYLTSHLNLDGTPIEDWKLLVSSASAEVSR